MPFFDSGMKKDKLIPLSVTCMIGAAIFYVVSLYQNAFQPKYCVALLSLFVITNAFPYKIPEHTLWHPRPVRIWMYIAKLGNILLMAVFLFLASGLEIELSNRTSTAFLITESPYINTIWLTYIFLIFWNLVYVNCAYANRDISFDQAVVVNGMYHESYSTYRAFPFLDYEEITLNSELTKHGRMPLLNIDPITVVKRNPSDKIYEFVLRPKLAFMISHHNTIDIKTFTGNAVNALHKVIDYKFKHDFKGAWLNISCPDEERILNGPYDVFWISSELTVLIRTTMPKENE